MLNAGFAGEFIDVKNVGRNSRPVLHKKDVVELIRKHVLLAYSKDVMFRSHHKVRGAACNPVSSKWSATLRQLRYSG